MSPTRTLRRQHAALLDLAGQLSASIKLIQSIEDAKLSSGLLAKMTGILSLHLAAEDNSLYPRLIASNDPILSKVARQFSDEMGGLSDAYMKFNDKWASAQAILDDPREFKTEAGQIIAALSSRIESEDKKLYPMLDELAEKEA